MTQLAHQDIRRIDRVDPGEESWDVPLRGTVDHPALHSLHVLMLKYRNPRTVKSRHIPRVYLSNFAHY